MIERTETFPLQMSVRWALVLTRKEKADGEKMSTFLLGPDGKFIEIDKAIMNLEKMLEAGVSVLENSNS